MKRSVLAVALVSLVIVSGCAATQLRAGAANVIATRQPAPKECRYLGTVIGQQGGSFGGGYTSNANLMQGSINDLKNKTAELGGNYVVMEMSQAGNTLSNGSGGQTDVTNLGNAYNCPPEALGGAPAAPPPPAPAAAPAPVPASAIVR